MSAVQPTASTPVAPALKAAVATIEAVSPSFGERAVIASDPASEPHELIAASDRRVSRVEQAGEAAIARDAVALRETAVQRLEGTR